MGPPPSWQVTWPWGFLPCGNHTLKMMWTVRISPLLWGRRFLKIPSPDGTYKVTEYLLRKHIDKASLAWKIKLLNLIKKFNTVLLWKLSKGLKSNWVLFKKNSLLFNRRIIALQNFVVFCQTCLRKYQATWNFQDKFWRHEYILHAKLLQLCLTLCDPVDCSRPGSSVHGIFQARMLVWVALPSSKGSSWPRDQSWIS